ncbi:MAG: hypothetical protein LBD13_04460, partial [Spirochaetaceae bacterium]|nr:hypothetical protein [Spirochaetaceae bacterium]
SAALIIKKHMPAPQEHIPAPQGHIPAPQGHIPAPQGHIPAPQGHIPAPQEHIPAAWFFTALSRIFKRIWGLFLPALHVLRLIAQTTAAETAGGCPQTPNQRLRALRRSRLRHPLWRIFKETLRLTSGLP